MAKMVGLSRAIKIEWLDKTVELILQEESEDNIKNALNEYLSFEIASPTNLRKTREILMHIWVYQSNDIQIIREIAIEALKSEKSNRLAVHWCMMLLNYPVFVDICGMIGKLSNIQDTFTTMWLKEKMVEEWGDRTTLFHSSDKILQTLKNFGVIKNQKVGVYQIKQRPVLDDASITVIVKTILHLKLKAYYEVSELSSVHQMFPFVFDVTHEWIYNSNSFELTNFGGKAVLMD